jgi:hypothetical protein
MSDTGTEQVAPSEEPPTTTLDTAAAELQPLAWGSVGDEPEEPQRHGWTRTMTIAAAIVGTAAVAATVAGVMLWPDRVPTPTPPTTSTTVAAAPPPAVATVAAPPVTVTQTPSAPAMPMFSPVADQQVMNYLWSKGYTQIDDPSLVIKYAHQWCALQQQGISRTDAMDKVTQQNAPGPQANFPAWGDIADAAILAYKVCLPEPAKTGHPD